MRNHRRALEGGEAMKRWRVDVIRKVREVYFVQAESKEVAEELALEGNTSSYSERTLDAWMDAISEQPSGDKE